MLDVHEVLKAAANGQAYIEWVDEDELVIGFASIQEVTESSIRLFYRLHGTRNVQRATGQIDIELKWGKGGRYWNKPGFVCPCCRNSCNRVYWMDGLWGCKSCHHLLPLVQRLTAVNKLIYQREKHELLLDDAKKNPPKRNQFEKSKAKYGEAVNLLATEHRQHLPIHYQFRSYGRWLEPNEMPHEPDMSDVGYGWTPGMAGQISGLADPTTIEAQAYELRLEERRRLRAEREIVQADEAAAPEGGYWTEERKEALRQEAVRELEEARAAEFAKQPAPRMKDPMEAFSINLFDDNGRIVSQEEFFGLTTPRHSPFSR